MRGYVRRRCSKCGATVKGTTCSNDHSMGKNGGWSFSLDVTPQGATRRKRITTIKDQHGRTVSRFATKKEAEEAMSTIEAAIREGTHVEASRMTTGVYLTKWAEGANVRASTRASYESHVRIHLVPRLGEIPLQALDRPAIRKAYADLTESGRVREKGPLSDMTVHHIHVTLHRALEDAVEDRLIPRNPADRAHRAPKAADRPEHNVWSESQVADFFRRVRDDRLFALWRLALMSGARRGELIGLRWSDFDLKAETVTFTRQRSRQGGQVLEGPTKTGRGRRTVDLDTTTIEALEEWAAQQTIEQIEWADAYENSGLVFTRENGSPLDPDGTSARWNRHVRASGLQRITFHEARHTHATLLLKAGVPIHVVSQRLGHSSVAFTLQQYGHVLPGQQQDAAAKLAAMIDSEASGR